MGGGGHFCLPLIWTSVNVCPWFRIHGGLQIYVLCDLCMMDPQTHLWRTLAELVGIEPKTCTAHFSIFCPIFTSHMILFHLMLFKRSRVMWGMWPAVMLAIKRSAGVAPEMNLRNSMQERKRSSKESTLALRCVHTDQSDSYSASDSDVGVHRNLQ